VASLVDDVPVLAEVEEVDAVLEVPEVAEVLEAAVLDEVPDVLLIPNAERALSSAVNSGLLLVELVDEDEEEAAESDASCPEPRLAWRVVSTEIGLVPVCAPFRL